MLLCLVPLPLVAWQDWDLVSTYPNAFRSLVPVFTKYTDAAFPTDDPVDTTSRVALRRDVETAARTQHAACILL